MSDHILDRMGIDAAKWADEYDRKNPGADWGTMVGWFANAIEAGRSAGRKETCQHSEPFKSDGVIVCRACGRATPA